MQPFQPKAQKRAIQVVLNLSVYGTGNCYGARLRKGLDAGGNVDAVAEYVVPVGQDVTEMNTDAELNRSVARCVLGRDRRLDVHGAACRRNHAGEFRQNSVAEKFYDPAAMCLDMGPETDI